MVMSFRDYKLKKSIDKDSISSPDPVTFRVIQQLSFDPKDRSWISRNILPELVTRFQDATPSFSGAVQDDNYKPTVSNIVHPLLYQIPVLYNSGNDAVPSEGGVETAVPGQEEHLYEKGGYDAHIPHNTSASSIDSVGRLLKEEISQFPDSKKHLFESLQLDESLFEDKRRSQELYSYIRESGGIERGLARLHESIKILATKEVNTMVADLVSERLGEDWKRFARRVQLDESKIEEIDIDYHSVYEKAIQCIKTWIRQTGEVVQWESLKIVLSGIPRQDIIRAVTAALVKEDQESNLVYHGSKRTKYLVDESINLDCNTDRHKLLQVHPGKLSNGINETPVAVKSFNVGNSVNLVKELHENADLMYRLQKISKCKNIVNIIDFHFEKDIKMFRLFTELCDFNLEQLLSDNLPDGVRQKISHVKVKLIVKKVGFDILNGLEFIHQNHEGSTFIHRDIKPDNVMFKIQYGECVAKINDFGICKITQSCRKATMTKLNQGSDLYMAPDIKQRSLSTGSKQSIPICDLRMGDMFACGITLFDMLCYGSHPFKGRSDVHTACNILDGNRKELLRFGEKTSLNLIYNLTEAMPNHRLTATEAKLHPTFFSSENTIELIKELKTKLQDAPTHLLDKFEGYNCFALDKDWREKVNEELFNEFNYFGEVKKSNGNGKYRKSLYDQLRFIRNVVEHRRRSNYKEVTEKVFGREAPSNHDLLTYFNRVFNGFLIHVYCTAVRVFPDLDFFKECGQAHLKIADSYERYLQYSFERSNSIDSMSKLSIDEEEVYYV